FSAVAGLVGGGGLGDLAMTYGYQRFDTSVMFVTVVLLIILVQLAQNLGNYFAKVFLRRS
ncbi:ABC transporter permease, partial [Acinetobacter baumannii]|nr:ABC transporter permease [Acinetobacter baumannii]